MSAALPPADRLWFHVEPVGKLELRHPLRQTSRADRRPEGDTGRRHRHGSPLKDPVAPTIPKIGTTTLLEPRTVHPIGP
jgi:hypothetical protein